MSLFVTLITMRSTTRPDFWKSILFLLSLKIKLPVIFTRKWVYLGMAGNVSLWQRRYSQNYKQVQQTKRRGTRERKRRELWRVVLNESPLDESESSGWGQFLPGWVARKEGNLPSSHWRRKWGWIWQFFLWWSLRASPSAFPSPF